METTSPWSPCGESLGFISGEVYLPDCLSVWPYVCQLVEISIVVTRLERSMVQCQANIDIRKHNYS